MSPNRNPEQFCIEDMCINVGLARAKQDSNFGSPKKLQQNVHPACKADEPNDSRVILLPLCPRFHGSTALEGILMSSTKISTLCTYNEWQCEGKGIMGDNGYDKYKQDSWNFTDMLRLYSEVWDLQQPVLLEKSPLREDGYSVDKENAGLRVAPMPDALAKLGVRELSRVYIILWRPYCLGWLSSHFQRFSDEKRKKNEMEFLRLQVEAHKYLVSQRERVLVINFADLIWQPSYSEERLKQFLPCLGNLDIDYVPELGKDVFEGNQWKVDGSVREFGASIDPSSCCDYDVESGVCNNVVNILPSDEFAFYSGYVNYLSNYS